MRGAVFRTSGFRDWGGILVAHPNLSLPVARPGRRRRVNFLLLVACVLAGLNLLAGLLLVTGPGYLFLSGSAGEVSVRPGAGAREAPQRLVAFGRRGF